MTALETGVNMFEEESNWTNLEEVWTTAASVVGATFVPSVSSEKPCEDEDFQDYKCNAEKSFEYLKTLLHTIVDKGKSGHSIQVDNTFLTSLLVLCAEHTCLKAWSSADTLRLSKEILDGLCQLHSCSTIGEYLVGGKTSVTKDGETQTNNRFKSALLHLHPKLLKETWKCYPAAVVAFKWLLFNVKFPYLNFDNSTVFTTSLIILDDFISENKIIGIQCLHHYTTNVTTTDFRAYGRDIVIYDALSSHLYTREPDILSYLLPCLLTTLKRMRPIFIAPDEDVASYVHHWERYDEVLNRIFSAMMLDDHVQVRMVYLKYLPAFIQARGLCMVLFTKQMLLVLEGYMDASGHGSTNLIKNTLEVFLVFMKTILRRLPAHALDIFQLLLKKLHDFTSQRNKSITEPDSEAVVHLIGENVKFLIQSAPAQFSDISIEYINSLGLNESGKSTLMDACQFG